MDKTLHDNEIFHFIYLILEREFLSTNKKIYKIGKSVQENMARFKSYPNSSILLFHCVCSDCHKIEKIIINNFKKKFIWRSDIGFEYFEGDYTQMIENIFYEICSFNIKKKEEELIISKKTDISFNAFNFVNTNTKTKPKITKLNLSMDFELTENGDENENIITRRF